MFIGRDQAGQVAQASWGNRKMAIRSRDELKLPVRAPGTGYDPVNQNRSVQMLIKAAFSVLVLTSITSAQVIYEPVTIRHGGQNAYYYAGTDQRIHEAAAFPSAPGAAWGRTGGYAFVNAHRAVVERTPRIFTDAFGSFDARVYGMTIDDVVNEANARVPRYFNKAQVIEQAAQHGGSMTVSPYTTSPETAEKGSIIIRPSAPPLFRRGPVLVIPKSMMDRKVSDVGGKKQV